MGIWEPDGRQTEEIAPAATFEVCFAPDGPAGMEGLLEQEQGGVFLPGQFFRRGELNAIPGDDKTAPFNEFIQGRLAIDVEMPVKLLVDGLQVTRPVESRVEILAEADRVITAQILPAEAIRQFPQDAFEEETICGQWLAAAVFAGGVELDMQGEEDFLQEQPLGSGETVRFPAQIRV
jgi:hypothetical protein